MNERYSFDILVFLVFFRYKKLVLYNMHDSGIVSCYIYLVLDNFREKLIFKILVLDNLMLMKVKSVKNSSFSWVCVLGFKY